MANINITPTFIAICLVGISLSACRENKSTPKMEETTVNQPSGQKPADWYTEPHRPQFHFSPEKMWTNDPNGMVFYEGEYHLFYQHYPDSAIWGPMHWAHAVSTDLTHWEHLPIGLYPDSLGYIFSGSAVVDWKNTTGFGQDGKPPLVAIYTSHDMKKDKAGRQDVESQSIAYSNDRGRTWTKYSGNPVLPNPSTGKEYRDFRDPKVFWHEPSKQWVVVLATGNHAEFWGSPDLKKWAYLSSFGKEFGTHLGVWECPDLFELAVENTSEKRWVLLININPGGPNGGSATQYFVGNFDGKNFTLDPTFAPGVANEKAAFMDFGKDNYASVSWSDVPANDGRRIIIGWMSNWQYANTVPTERWRNAMTLPRSLHLVKTANTYRLDSKPVVELQKLRGKSADLAATEITGTLDLTEKLGFSPRLSELELEFELPADGKSVFGAQLSNSKNESYRIGYNAETKQFFSDRVQAGEKSFSKEFAKSFSLAPRFSGEKTVRLHLYFDTASAELFADGGSSVMTEIFFPKEDFNKLSLFSVGGKTRLVKGKVWELKGIWH